MRLVFLGYFRVKSRAFHPFQARPMSVISAFRSENLPSLWREGAIWLLIVLYLGLVVRYAWDPTPFAQILAAIGIASALAHGICTYGWRDTLAFLAICLIVTFALENFGSLTGWLFGRYHFEVGAELPHVGVIPVIVGPLWFGMGYFAWIVGATLLGGADRNLDRHLNIVAQPLVSAFVMTQWDFVMDAPASTISGTWIWHDGGAVFGVPLTNYAGWLLTSWIFYQLFALYLLRCGPVRRSRPALRLVAILFYLCAGLTHLTPWLMGQSGEVADAAGHIWRIQDVREATVVTMLFTMLFTSVLAALRLARDDTQPID
jgi:putative membrane protein